MCKSRIIITVSIIITGIVIVHRSWGEYIIWEGGGEVLMKLALIWTATPIAKQELWNQDGDGLAWD